jgi:hypothetical protein
MTRTRIRNDFQGLGLAIVCPRAALPSSGED